MFFWKQLKNKKIFIKNYFHWKLYFNKFYNFHDIKFLLVFKNILLHVLNLSLLHLIMSHV